MAFIDTLRETQRYTQDDAERRSNTTEEWDNISKQFMDSYNSYLKNTGRKEISLQSARQKLRDFIGKAGAEDGKWSANDYANSNYDEYDFQEYGTKTLKDLFGENGGMDFKAYLDKYGDDDQKKTYERLSKKSGTAEKIARGLGADLSLKTIALGGPLFQLGALGGAALAAGADSKSKASLAALEKEYLEKHSNALNTAFDAFENADKYLSNRDKVSSGESESAGTGSTNQTNNTTEETTEDEVTFTLPRANDPNYRGFGQKIVDLGLATNKGLWGSDGDVQFYTKQLYDQGALDQNGNLKIGVPIKLRKRKVTR